MKYRLDDESLREGKFRIDENTGILFTRIGFEEDVGLSYSLTVRESVSNVEIWILKAYYQDSNSLSLLTTGDSL